MCHDSSVLNLQIREDIRVGSEILSENPTQRQFLSVFPETGQKSTPHIQFQIPGLLQQENAERVLAENNFSTTSVSQLCTTITLLDDSNLKLFKLSD